MVGGINEVRRAASRRNRTYSNNDGSRLVKGLGDDLSLKVGLGDERGLGDDCSLRLGDLLDLGSGLDHLFCNAFTSNGGRNWDRVSLEDTSAWVGSQACLDWAYDRDSGKCGDSDRGRSGH